MRNEEELLKLKEEYDKTRKEIDSFGQIDKIIELSLWLKALIEESEKLKKQLENIQNKSIRYKIKFKKKPAKLYKEECIFEATISNEMKNQSLSLGVGRRMLSIIELLKRNKIDSIGSRFDYFENIIKINGVYKKNREELQKEKSNLERELNKSNNLLKDIGNLNSIEVDDEKVNLYKNYLSRLNKLDSLRKQYIKSLLSLNIAELIEKVKKDSLITYGFPNIDENKLEMLYTAFKEDNFFLSKDISAICKMFEYSDDRIAHIYPEVSKFKRIILANRVWFDKIYKLKNSNFAAFNEKAGTLEKLKPFYLNQIPESKEIIEGIEKQKDNIKIYKTEYEKSIKYESEIKKLSDYSKSELEKQVVKYKRMLKMLGLGEKQKHTERTINNTDIKENTDRDSMDKDGEKKEKKGIFNRLKSFFGS